jgi:hypothetical protein
MDAGLTASAVKDHQPAGIQKQSPQIAIDLLQAFG